MFVLGPRQLSNGFGCFSYISPFFLVTFLNNQKGHHTLWAESVAVKNSFSCFLSVGILADFKYVSYVLSYLLSVAYFLHDVPYVFIVWLFVPFRKRFLFSRQNRPVV